MVLKPLVFNLFNDRVGVLELVALEEAAQQ